MAQHFRNLELSELIQLTQKDRREFNTMTPLIQTSQHPSKSKDYSGNNFTGRAWITLRDGMVGYT